MQDHDVPKAFKGLKTTTGDELATCCAVYLENPDGTYSLGLPPNLQLPSPPSSPRQRLPSSPFLAELGGSTLPPLSPTAFLQHERLMTGLLVLELVVEIAYLTLLCHASRHSIHEVAMAYEALPLESLWSLFWVQLCLQIGYLKLYFCVGFSAVSKHKPRIYGFFSNVALGGIVIQVLFSYMNKSNIFVFALRLFCYVYARFLRSALLQLALQPQPDLDV